MNRIIRSEDGSDTIHSDKFNVSYHSKYGAIQETQTVFIEAGLNFILAQGKQNISILEMGFGTGLNAIMTLQQLSDRSDLIYHTIEAYPLSEEHYKQLNYPEVLNLDSKLTEAFLQMHDVVGNQEINLQDQFKFTKFLSKIEDYTTSQKYDVIYYDAFAPTSQEELWTQELMTKLFHFCNPGAVLVTYCAKGSFKRALKSAGFQVEALDGPIGKREMTRAHKVKLIS